MTAHVCRLSLIAAALCFIAPGCHKPVADAGAAATEAEAPPGIASFDPRMVELGDVPLYSDKQFTAKFVNRGTATIEIAGFEARCGCAVLGVTKKVCEPGEQIEVTGVFKAGAAGAFRKQLAARSKDGGVYEFEIVGYVKPQIAFDQDGITLTPDFLEGKGASGAVEIANHSNATINLQQPVGLPPEVQARLEQTEIRPGKSAKLLISVTPAFVVNTDVKVDVATSHRLEGMLSISVRVRPTQALTVVPGEVRLGVASKKQLLKRGKLSVTLLGKALDRVTIDNVECPPYLKLEARDTNAARRTELQFIFVDSFAGVDLVGEIKVNMIDRNPQGGKRTIKLRVPISGLLEES